MVFLKKWWRTSSGTLRGAVWMILAGACFAGLGVTIRLSAADIDILEVIFFRNFFKSNFDVTLVVAHRLGGSTDPKTGPSRPAFYKRLGSHVFLVFGRYDVATGGSHVSWFYSSLVCDYGCSPVFKRRCEATSLGRRRCCFLGTLIILRPGIEIISPGAILMIVGAVFVAISFLLVKVLSRTEPPNTMVLYMSLLITPVSAIPLIWVWEMPHGLVWLWLLGVGASATCGHLCFTRAMASADASAVLPYEYVRLIFVAIIAFFLFGEVPDLWTWLGSVVIFGSGVYIANREAAAFKSGRKMKLLAAQASGETSKP